MSKAVLILGATGKQGGGVLRALLAHPGFSPNKYTIYAATRDPTSASAKRLAALSPSITLVAGDLRNPVATFATLPTKPWAVFVVTYPGKTETSDGIGTIDAAVAAGASHVVFSSVDRGQGNPPTQVPHFITKHNIEVHLKTFAAESDSAKLSYTIIRPPFFLDNLEPGFMGKAMASLWKNKVKGPLAVIDTADIGKFGAAALLEPDSPVYHNAELNIAGDKLTFEKASEIFRRKTGHDIPMTFGLVPSLLLFMVDDMQKMVDFFNDPGFIATPEESNQLYHMTNFEDWVGRSRHLKREV
jgi:uncharacterized protein YbjT (DUF2867 family)